MKVNVHIRGWMTTVHCGIGNQPIRWVADIAVNKYDRNYNFAAGTPIGLKFENGVEVDLRSD